MYWTLFRHRFGQGAAVLILSLLATGCGMDLETGYKYRPLGASSTERRAYYASPFSPEKSAADQERQKGNQAKPVGQEP